MGVEVVVLQSGDGQRPRVGDTVTTHYVGTIVSNGSTFGSSLVRLLVLALMYTIGAHPLSQRSVLAKRSKAGTRVFYS